MFTSHHIAAQLARELQRDRLEAGRGSRLAAMLGRERDAVAHRSRSRIVRQPRLGQGDARASERRWRPSRVFDRARF